MRKTARSRHFRKRSRRSRRSHNFRRSRTRKYVGGGNMRLITGEPGNADEWIIPRETAIVNKQVVRNIIKWLKRMKNNAFKSYSGITYTNSNPNIRFDITMKTDKIFELQRYSDDTSTFKLPYKDFLVESASIEEAKQILNSYCETTGNEIADAPLEFFETDTNTWRVYDVNRNWKKVSDDYRGALKSMVQERRSKFEYRNHSINFDISTTNDENVFEVRRYEMPTDFGPAVNPFVDYIVRAANTDDAKVNLREYFNMNGIEYSQPLYFHKTEVVSRFIMSVSPSTKYIEHLKYYPNRNMDLKSKFDIDFNILEQIIRRNINGIQELIKHFDDEKHQTNNVQESVTINSLEIGFRKKLTNLKLILENHKTMTISQVDPLPNNMFTIHYIFQRLNFMQQVGTMPDIKTGECYGDSDIIESIVKALDDAANDAARSP